MDNDYSQPTDAQYLRDMAFIEHVKGWLVDPLCSDLKRGIPGYSKLKDWGKYKALSKMNQKAEEAGAMLLLDFGTDEKGRDMRTAVFAGVPLNYANNHNSDNQLIVYEPAFIDSRAGINGNADSWTPISKTIATANVGFFIEQNQDYFNSLPLPFRIAATALYITQNVLTTKQGACRFAAGMSDAPPLMRWDATPLISGQAQVIGWNITIRDAVPTNPMLSEIARQIKNLVIDTTSDGAERLGNGLARFDGYDPTAPKKRGIRGRTKELIDFVDRYLPKERGVTPGKNGFTWDDACNLFNQLHPGTKYKDGKSFYKAQKQAKDRWEVDNG